MSKLSLKNKSVVDICMESPKCVNTQNPKNKVIVVKISDNFFTKKIAWKLNQQTFSFQRKTQPTSTNGVPKIVKVNDVALGYPPQLKHDRLSIWLSIPVMFDGTRVTIGAEKYIIQSRILNLSMTMTKTWQAKFRQSALCGIHAWPQ